MTKKTKTKTKKKARTEEPPEPPPVLECIAPGCNAPPFPNSEFCVQHMVTSMAVDFADRHLRRGRASGLLGAAGALIAQNPQVLNAAAASVAQLLGGFRPSGNGGPPPPQQQKLDPFAYLGLDPTQATSADVKRIQRELAKIYHPDKMGEAVASAKMQEVNQAAAAALESLRRQGRG